MNIRHHCARIACVAALLAALSATSALAQQSQIQILIGNAQLPGMRWPNFVDYRATLQNFYSASGFTPVWLNGNQPTAVALSLIQIFQRADQKGLNPEDYDASRWPHRLDDLRQSKDTATVARFDVALTVSTMRYIDALFDGRIHTKHLGHPTQHGSKDLNIASFIRDQVIHSQNVSSAIAGIEPPFAAYRRTEKALAHYEDLAHREDGGKLPTVRKTVDPGQNYAGMPLLRRLLLLVGDLPQSYSPPTDAQLYDAPVVDAVKRFQRRHGLEEDGRLGAATIRQLNVPLQQRVRQLQLSLERWRWLPHSFPAPPIFVNIPDFRLRAVTPEMKVDLDMRVVVGRAMRTKTPVFAAEMTHVIFRPYWNVPRSILRNEIIPDIQRNRNYIAKNNFEVTTLDGRVVTDGSISDSILDQLRNGALAVRQKPGDGNALGLVKLVFPNGNDVYLHDTPSTRLFARARRDFSHGCIRVEKPAELAAWALRNNPGWSLERVRNAMQNGPDNVTVNLAQSIPVFIVYGTAIAYANGEVHFSDDIYHFDTKLIAELNKGYPYP
ncbi:MAG: L,D-transpeptidase family protein [Acidobacteriota bacterium]|nr:L,D-transpeptidase family protein [Acidobacteriota bacterium]